MDVAAAPPRPFRAAGPVEAIRALALGANLWAITLLLPVLHGGVRDGLDMLAIPLPLLPLAIGAYALATSTRRPLRALAVAMLLFGYPVTLAGALALRADLADRDAWGALGLAASAVSALAYGGVAAEACSRPIALRTSTAQSLAVAVIAADPPARTWLRRVVLGGTTLGAIAVAVIAPAMGSRVALLRAWGEAADEATVLASIVGAGACSIGIAALLGPRLRAPRAGEIPSARSGWVIVAAIVVALAGIVALGILRSAEG